MAQYIKRFVVRRSDALIVPGVASHDYVVTLGGDRARTFFAPNAVDNDYFARAIDLRQGHSDVPNVLFVGRLEAEKGLRTLQDAWNGDMQEKARLTIVGNGKLRAELEDWARTRPAGAITVTGHLNRDALVQAYADADVFVFPSLSDPWGLVLNEAMAAGLPVVTSSRPGAVDDLVTHGETGLVVSPGDSQELRSAMQLLVADSALRSRIGQAASKRIQGYSPQRCAEGLATAIRALA